MIHRGSHAHNKVQQLVLVLGMTVDVPGEVVNVMSLGQPAWVTVCGVEDVHMDQTSGHPREQIGLCLSAPPPTRFLTRPSASFWGNSTVHNPLSQHTHLLLVLPLPTSFLPHYHAQPCWYSNSVRCYDLINGIWLPAWIPEMGMAF